MSRWSDPQPDSRFAAVDGLRIHFKRAGQGPVVVLLHGSASSLRHFEQVAAVLSGSFDVTRPDLSGFRLTGPRADRDYRIRAYASTVARFLDMLGVHEYAVAGNSLGGNIAWNLALEAPGRVTALVLVNATGYPEKTVPRDCSFIQLPGGVTHYELAGPGDGDVAVLVGGLTVPLFYWDALAADLYSLGLRTLAYSLYGRGYSDRVRARYDEALFAWQLSELVNALCRDQPLHLVGASMGALISMTYAQAHTVRLSTLTVVGPAGLARQRVPLHVLLCSDVAAGLVARGFGSRLLRGHLGHNVRDPQRGAERGAGWKLIAPVSLLRSGNPLEDRVSESPAPGA